MAQEIHIFVGNSGRLTSELQDSKTITQDPTTAIYVFEKPLELQKFIEGSPVTSSSESSSAVLSFPEVRRIRLSILKSISHSQITELEANGGVNGPNISPLFQAWREAIRLIPKAI